MVPMLILAIHAGIWLIQAVPGYGNFASSGLTCFFPEKLFCRNFFFWSRRNDNLQMQGASARRPCNLIK